MNDVTMVRMPKTMRRMPYSVYSLWPQIVAKM